MKKILFAIPFALMIAQNAFAHEGEHASDLYTLLWHIASQPNHRLVFLAVCFLAVAIYTASIIFLKRKKTAPSK